MKQIIEKTGLYILLAALAVLLVVAGGIGFNLGKRQTDAGLIPVSALSSLQDSLKTVRADLKSAGDMIATLRDDSTAKGGKIRLQAATIADMTAKLAKLSGGGPGKPVDDTWSVYQDKALTAFYRQRPDTLTYQLEPRALQISLIEGLDNTWSAYAWDVMAGCPAVIDTLDIQRNREWAPPRPWYKFQSTRPRGARRSACKVLLSNRAKILFCESIKTQSANHKPNIVNHKTATIIKHCQTLRNYRGFTVSIRYAQSYYLRLLHIHRRLGPQMFYPSFIITAQKVKSQAIHIRLKYF